MWFYSEYINTTRPHIQPKKDLFETQLILDTHQELWWLEWSNGWFYSDLAWVMISSLLLIKVDSSLKSFLVEPEISLSAQRTQQQSVTVREIVTTTLLKQLFKWINAHIVTILLQPKNKLLTFPVALWFTVIWSRRLAYRSIAVYIHLI